MKISNIFLVTALVCLNGEVANADIAYYLDNYIGTDRVFGDIVTDGTLGSDVTRHIIGWTLTLETVTAGTFTLSSASGNSTFQNQVQGIGGYFSATPTELLFDFVNSSASYFQGVNNFGVGYEFGLRGAVYPVVNGPPGPGEGIEVNGLSPVIQIKPMSGIAVIATTTGSIPAVPEASTWAMLLLGFAGLGFAGYRRMNWRGLEGPAAS